MDYKEVLACALTIGEGLLVSGAEVSRVEDTVKRILTAYNAVRVDVFTITSSMVVTADFGGGNIFTQTRRITEYGTDFNKIDLYNNLSRYICKNMPSCQYVQSEIQRIETVKEYGFVTELFAAALIAGAFTLFFGGCFSDAVISSVIGMILRVSVRLTEKIGLNMVFSNIILSFLASSLAHFAVIGGADRYQ